MTHILMKNYGGAKLMICGYQVNGDPVNGDAIVGTGKGQLVDGDTTAAQQAASVDCQGCTDKFPTFNGGKTLAEVAAGG